MAGGSMAGWLGGSLARSFGRLVASLTGGFAAGLMSHRAQKIVGILDAILNRTSLDYQTQCTRNHGSHRQSRTLTMMVLEMLADRNRSVGDYRLLDICVATFRISSY